MKPLADTMTARSTIGGETRAMSIDADATAHLMGLLTNIYSDPIMAVIREYSTNGLDATIEAGSADPIRVTLPTFADPNLRIQDFGVGMTTDTILDHYSLYGRSDKRDSNEVVGMLGIGCKSALTYSNTFSIESVRNGVRTVALVAKNADGVGEIEIVDTVSTNERNGTTIIVPVKSGDLHKFANAAETLFQYWDAGTVLVNGESVPSVFDDLAQIPGMNVWYAKHSGLDHIVLMGNVAYRCTSDLLNDFRGRSLVIKAEIGDVSFAPSREELFYNVRTNDYLRQTVQKIKDAVRAEVEAVSKTATSKPEAFALRGRNGQFSFLSDVKWEYAGEKIPAFIDGDGSSIIWSRESYPYDNAKAESRWRVEGADTRTIFIHNYPYTSASKRVKESLAKWSDDDQHAFAGMKRFVLSSKIVSPWVESYDWNDFKADLVKTTPNPSGRFVNPRSGRIIDQYGNVNHHSDPASDFPDAEFLVLTPDDIRGGNSLSVMAIQVGVKPVLVYKRDVSAFEDAYSTIDKDTVRQRWNDIDKNRTDDDYFAQAVRDDDILSKIDAKKILDPDIAAVLQYREHGKKVSFAVNKNYNRAHAATQKAQASYKGYPLLATCYRYQVNGDMITDYINALYTYKNGN
jgi:hypothetical protein